MVASKVDPKLSLSDGLYAGLIGGAVLSLFFLVTDLLIHDPPDSLYLFLSSAVLGRVALSGGWMPLSLGVALLFLLAAIGGIAFALLARKIAILVKTPISTLAGLLYGFIVWLVFVDIVVPLTGMQQTIDHPLWISAAGIGIFYGSALCEYLANVARLRAARAADQAPLPSS